jgi:effector-binding domain-containing protein
MLRAVFLILAVFIAVAAAAEDKFSTSVELLGRTPSDLAVERVTLNAVPVAIEKAQGKLNRAPAELPKAIDALKARLKEKGIDVVGAPLAQFNAADEENYSAEIMLPLAALPKQPPTGLHFGHSPAGKALRVMHKGPLASLEDTYFEIQTFVEDQGLEIGEVTIERYLTDPVKTAEKDMLIEVFVPLK